jgi:hypothetical protein
MSRRNRRERKRAKRLNRKSHAEPVMRQRGNSGYTAFGPALVLLAASGCGGYGMLAYEGSQPMGGSQDYEFSSRVSVGGGVEGQRHGFRGSAAFFNASNTQDGLTMATDSTVLDLDYTNRRGNWRWSLGGGALFENITIDGFVGPMPVHDTDSVTTPFIKGGLERLFPVGGGAFSIGLVGRKYLDSENIGGGTALNVGYQYPSRR